MINLLKSTLSFLILVAIILALCQQPVKAGVGEIEYNDPHYTETTIDGTDTSTEDGRGDFDSDDGGILDDIWDFVTDTVGPALGDFFSDLGDMIGDGINAAIDGIADAWNSLSPWTQDLIITIGVVVAIVAVIIVAAILIEVIAVAIAIAAIIGTIAFAAFYFINYGGTDQFSFLNLLGFTLLGTVVGGAFGWLFEIGAFGAMFAALRTGASRFASWLGVLLRNGWSKFTGAMVRGWQALATQFRNLISASKSLLTRFSAQMVRAWQAFLTGLRAAGRWTKNLVMRIKNGIVTFYRNNAPRVAGFLKTLYGGWGKFALTFGIGAGISFAIDIIKFIMGEDLDPLQVGLNAIINGLTAGVGLPVVNSIKLAIQGKRWLSLLGWSGFGGILGGLSNMMMEFTKTGILSFENFGIGFGVGIISLPFAVLLINAAPPLAEFISQNVGSFITDRLKDIIYWNNPNKHPENGLKNLYKKGLNVYANFVKSIKEWYLYRFGRP